MVASFISNQTLASLCLTMKSSQLDAIEADFKLLQSEFRKKNPQIRESVEGALAWLTQVKQSNSTDKTQGPQPTAILEPLRLLFVQKVAKAYPVAINLLQKITQVFQVVEHGTLLLTLSILREASQEVSDEMSEIRILQMLLTFLDPRTIQLSKEFVTIVMQSCFQMMDTKSLAVKSTIQATLKQLFTIVLERFVDDCKKAIPQHLQRDIFSAKKTGAVWTQEDTMQIQDLLRDRFQSGSEGDTSYLVVREIIQNLAFTVLSFEQRSGVKKPSAIATMTSTQGAASASAAQSSASPEQQALNFKSSPYSRCIVLDLINLCLTMTNEVLRFFPEVVSIFELQVAPTIEPLLQQRVPQSSIGMRLMKCATLIINNLNVSLNLLRTILSDAEGLTSRQKDGTLALVSINWRSLIAFECLQVVLSNPGLADLFAMSSLSIGAPILLQILECFISAAKALEQSKDPLVSSQSLGGGQGNSRSGSSRGLYQSTQKIAKVIDSQNLDGEISPPSLVQIQRIIIESICTFSNNFVYVFSAIGIKLGTPQESRGKNRDTEESPSLIKCKRMLTLCWKPLLECLQRLIRTTPDESNIQMLLKAFQSCIGACGSANCYEARDAFLKALCGECTTESSSNSANAQSSQSSQASQSQSLGSQTREILTGRRSLASVNIKPSAQSNATSSSEEPQITINDRNVLICKTFFNIALCLCHVLDVKSWFLILETMQQIETVIHKKLQINGLIARKDRPAFNQDGNQLIINFEELKKKVGDKMTQFNIVERSQNQSKKPGQHHSRLSISGNGSITTASRPSFSMLVSPGTMAAKSSASSTPKEEHNPHQIQLPALSIASDRISIQPYKPASGQGSNPFEEARNDLVIGSSQSQVGRSTMDPLLAELHSLQESFDLLFTSTLLFDMQSLAELICALAQLTVGVLENFHNPVALFSQGTGLQRQQSTESEILAQINTFAMSRLVETALVNVSRIDNIWKIIVAHFDILSNCQVLAIRQLTIEALQTIVLAIFAHKKTVATQAIKAQKNAASDAVGKAGPRLRQKSSVHGENISDADEYEMDESISNKNGASQSDISSQLDDSVHSTQEESKRIKSGRSFRSNASSAASQKQGDESWQNSTWQYTVLVPLADQLKSTHDSDKLSVIKGFEKIIQTCGQQIKNEGWRIIIVTISKSLEHESEQVVACGFRCLKLVVSNYINRLSQQNFVTVLNAIHMYASNTGSNINNNLIAICMFQNVADYAAKQIGQVSSTTDSSVSIVFHKTTSINFEKIWEILFERIQSLGCNRRAEVRKTTVHTLENIVMTHGAALMVGNSWPKVLKDTVLGMLKSCVERYAQNSALSSLPSRDSDLRGVPAFGSASAVVAKPPGEMMVAPTPTFFGSGVSQTTGKAQPKMQFDDATVTKALKQNDSQWEETCTVLCQTACRSLKKYFQVYKDKGVQGQAQRWELAQDFWSELTDNLNLMLSVGSTQACTLIFKALINFLSEPDCQRLFLGCEDETRTFLTATIDYLAFEQENFETQKTDRNRTIKLLKICPIVIETLQKLYTPQTLVELKKRQQTEVKDGSDHLSRLISKDFSQTILSLLEMLLSTSKAAESLQSFGTNKLLSEERTVFDFIESMSDFYSLKTDTQQAYLDMVFKFTEYTGASRQEAIVKRAFSILYGALLRGAIHREIVSPFVKKLIDRMKELIELRYDGQACVQLVFQAKGQQTLFLTIGYYFIHMTSYLINPEQFSARLQSTSKAQQPPSQTGLGKADQSTDSKDKVMLDDFEQPCPLDQIRPNAYSELGLSALVWPRVIELLQTTLLFDLSRVQQDHNKAVLTEVAKQSQELDMHVMNFILNCLLPNSALQGGTSGSSQAKETQKVLEQSLVHIIDQGCSNGLTSGGAPQVGFGAAAGATGSGQAGTANLSRYCFTNMFDLCRYSPEQSTSLVQGQTPDALNDIKLKIASIATPILINRCKQTLKKFIKDDAKVGSVGMSKSRVAEVVFIIDKLRDLDCFPHILTSSQASQTDHETSSQQRTSLLSQGSTLLMPIAGGSNFKKGHLIELMPVFSDLILRDEQSIKESLRMVFLDISLALNENMRAVQEAMQTNAAAAAGNGDGGNGNGFFGEARGGDHEFGNRVSTGGAAEDGNRGSSGGEGE